jgi:hypothetical protein
MTARNCVIIAQTKHMVLTRAAANNQAATSATASATISKPKVAAQAAKKAKDTERARMEVMKQSCIAAQKKRDEAAATAYIGTMKYLGKYTTPTKSHCNHILVLIVVELITHILFQDCLYMFLEHTDDEQNNVHTER